MEEEPTQTPQETLVQKATVELPQPIYLQEFEKMLAYVAKSLPVDITFRASYFGNVSERSKGDIDYGSTEVGGMIKSTRVPMAFDNFTTSTSDRDYRKIARMKFSIIPGYDEDDHRPEVRQLWSDVRAAVERYFAERRSGE